MSSGWLVAVSRGGLRIRSVLLAVAELFIEAIHQRGVGDEDQDEADDRALLSHPESEGSMAYRREVVVEPGSEDDSASE